MRAVGAFSSTPSIQLAVVNSDGSAAGHLSLDARVNVATSLTDLPDNPRVWQLQGAGTLTPGGATNGWVVYSPPDVLPANRSVTITVWVDSSPSVTASYTFLLLDPVPVISSTSPSKLETHGTARTQVVQIDGSGFIPATVISLNGTALETTYENSQQVAVTVPVGSVSSNLSLTAHNPGPGGGTTAAYVLPVVYPVPNVTGFAPTELLSGGTQKLAFSGSGFTPATTVLFNGAALPITYTDYDAGSVEVPVPDNASGNLTLQAKNPGPGGGVGTSFTVSVPPTTMTLTAKSTGGTNTAIADLDFSITMSAEVTGSIQTAVNWSLTGAGSISGSGVYTPPAIMPSDRTVTIKATLASNPAITSSYTATIHNPVPTIAEVAPLLLSPGETTSVTLTGTGFLPSTVILVNGNAVPTSYQSAEAVVAKISIPENETGNVTLQGQNPGPGGGTGEEFEQAISAPVSLTAAGRLLNQTTFGPTTALIQHVQQEGVTAWLAEQYATPQTVLPVIPTTLPSYGGNAEDFNESEWWQTVLTGNDQLRQRVAFALSELFVISQDSMPGWEVQYYANLLATDAFSNWYTIMNDVTLSPAMGVYLNMFNSAKPTGTLIANENFARENMQLFNLGLDLINQDGTLQLDGNGNPIPAYTEAQVEAFSRAFTGWTSANPDGSTPTTLIGLNNFYHQMVAVESQHDENPKTLLNGTTLPAGQTAEEDLAGALTNVFEHPNLPPFVCKQLIQHLVKSNPSPEYVSRVAAVFINDGNNVRGDMQAVLTAIFTDPEARAGDTAQQASDGHLREPILYLTGVMRGLGYVNVDPNNYYWYLSVSSGGLNEIPYASPSVFNFFPAGYVVPGTSLNGPEFGLENTGSVVDRLTLANSLVWNNIEGFSVDLSTTSPLGKILSSQGSPGLVNALDNLFLCGMMGPNTAAAITEEIRTAPEVYNEQKLRLAIYLVITSSKYTVLH